MSDYRIIGAEESPYSVKVRSYLRFKGLPHTWMSRSEAGKLYAEHAKLPLIPLLITPDDRGLQDSTPIIETVELAHPDPTIYPDPPVSRFISALLEEFADEWGNKWMFHYRWAREVDQRACARRLAEAITPGAAEADLASAAESIRERMVDRVWFVGSSPTTAPLIEASFRDSLELLEAHLAARPYLFGGQPAFADFALWGQLYNCHRDPTPRGIIESRSPHVLTWIHRMQDPGAQGAFEPWTQLAPTLTPLLKDQVSAFLAWSHANARALEAGSSEYTVRLHIGSWTQKPQKYHARSLTEMRRKYHAAASPELDEVLDAANCLELLRRT